MADGAWDRSDDAAASAPPATDAGRRRSSLPWLLVGLLFAFLLGLIGSPLAERQAREMLPPAFREDAAPLPPAPIANLAERLDRLEAEVRDPPAPAPVPATPAAGTSAQAAMAPAAEARLDARIDTLAAELARLDRLMDGSDARMRELFVLAVAQRMLEEGRPLTALREALQAAFGTQDGAALEALQAWSAAPQTRSTLAGRLDLLEDAPAPEAQAGWWERLTGRLQGLVKVREPGAASEEARDHLADARAHLAAGHLDLALAALESLPPTRARMAWIADARLLLAAEDGLARLEAEALDRAIAEARTPAPPAQSAGSAASPRG